MVDQKWCHHRWFLGMGSAFPAGTGRVQSSWFIDSSEEQRCESERVVACAVLCCCVPRPSMDG